MAIGLLDVLSQQLTKQTALVATGTAADVFTFDSPPPGTTWTGTLSIAPAQATLSTPTSATFSADVGATNWGSWGGSSVYGPVQCQSTQQLVIPCQGLAAGVAYVASWIGSSDPSSAVQPIYPAANSTALTAQIQGVAPGLIASQTLVSGGGSVTGAAIPIPPSIRTLILRLSPNNLIGGISNVLVQGTITLTNYYNQAPYLIGNLASNWYTIVVPVNAIIDTSVKVTISVGAGQSITVQVFGDSAQYDESVFYNGTIKGAVIVGAGVLLQGPARLLTLEASSGVGASFAITAAGGQILRADGGTSTTGIATITFPPNTILSGQLTTAGTGTANVSYAYP